MVHRARVLLVDYDTITREGVRAVLEQGSAGEVVGFAQGVSDLPDQLRALEPDVVITNTLENGGGESGVDSVEVMRVVGNHSSNIPVIVLTQDENDPYALNAVAAGISAYILRKNASAEVLGAVIQSVIEADTTVISSPLMNAVLASLSTSANQVLGNLSGVDGLHLTPRELEVVKLLAVGETNEDISITMGISHETTRKHVGRVVEKLRARNRTHAAIIAARSGISGSAGPAITGEMVRAATARNNGHGTASDE